MTSKRFVRLQKPRAISESTQIILAFTFGVIFITAMLVLGIRYPQPTRFQYQTFVTVLALAAAGVAAMVPGLLELRLGPKLGIWIRAGGAMAVFVIVFFFSPAGLVADDPTTHINSLRQAAKVELERKDNYAKQLHNNIDVIINWDHNQSFRARLDRARNLAFNLALRYKHFTVPTDWLTLIELYQEWSAELEKTGELTSEENLKKNIEFSEEVARRRPEIEERFREWDMIVAKVEEFIKLTGDLLRNKASFQAVNKAFNEADLALQLRSFDEQDRPDLENIVILIHQYCQHLYANDSD